MIFFNNVGVLNMCGHGTIGLLVTLAHLGRIDVGTHRIETPVGIVEATLHGPNEVTIKNVPSYRFAKDVAVEVEGIGQPQVKGDIAWGGNWFFLVKDHPLEINLANLERLTDFTVKIREGLERQGSPARTAARSTTSKSSARPRSPIARTSSSAPARPTTAPPAAPAPAPSSPAWPPTASSRKARSGGRKASSAASSKGSSPTKGTGRSPTSKGPPTSTPRPP